MRGSWRYGTVVIWRGIYKMLSLPLKRCIYGVIKPEDVLKSGITGFPYVLDTILLRHKSLKHTIISS